MADVFISYAREDRARAEQIARGLEAQGLNVFWDSEIPPGQTWADYIETKLTECKAAVVLWSANSTKSQWVREEARMGRDKGVLIPVMIDTSQAPFGFGEVQAANLANWNGEAEHPDWRRFVEAVRGATSGAARPAPQPMSSAQPRAHAQPAMAPPPVEAKKGGVPAWVWIVGAVVGVLVLLGVIGSMVPDETTQQTAAVNPAMQTQPAGPGPSQSAAQYQQQILARLAQVEQTFAAQGFQQIAAPATGQLPQGQVQNWPLTLNVGIEYRVIGVCDNDCGDLDLALLDGYGQMISQDQSTDATPVVSVIPTTSGQFGLQALMYNCNVAPCYYALVLYGRQIQ